MTSSGITSRWRMPVDLTEWGISAAVMLAIFAGMALAMYLFGSWAGLAVGLSPIVLTLIALKSWARMLVVVVGGMLVLGSSADVGASKLAYTAALVLCTLVSLLRLMVKPPVWGKAFMPLIGWGLIFLGCLAIGTVAGSGQDLLTVARQSLFYLMVLFAPIVGLDVGRDMKPMVVMRWIGVVGTIAAVGFATDWLNRRGVSNLPVSKFVLSSLMLPALAFSLTLVRLTYAKGIARFLWIIPLTIIPAAMLVTGTRTNLILFFAIIGVIGATAKFRVNVGRTVVLATLGVGIAFMSIPVLAPLVLNRPEFIDNRLQAAFNVLSGSAEGDASFAGRSLQYGYANDLIAENPLFGMGPGYSAPMSLDTPLATVVRLGIVGTIVLVAFLLTAYFAIQRTGAIHGFSQMHTAVRGLAVVFLANIPFGTPLEDRGFGFMVLLSFMGIAAYLQEKASGRDAEEELATAASLRREKRVALKRLPAWAPSPYRP